VTLTREDEDSVAIWFPMMGETPTGLAVHDDDKQDRGVLLSDNKVFQAVLKFGVDQWYSIGLKMMTDPEVTACTFDKPSLESKLEAIIQLKVLNWGVKRTEECLLRACKTIAKPIIEAVEGFISGLNDCEDGAH
jgi:hypothetical protein